MNLLQIRHRWFWSQAKAFVQRHQMGMMVLALFLPGVAISTNLAIFYQAIATPIIHITGHGQFSLMWLGMAVITQGVMLVWARAQREAIVGGAFARQQLSWPIPETKRRQIDALMLLLSNHLLWVLWFAPVFFHDFGQAGWASDLQFVSQWLGLLVLCVSGQWWQVFEHRRRLFQLWLLTWALVIVLPWLAFVAVFLPFLIKTLVNRVFETKPGHKPLGTRLPYPWGLYWHMLFSAQRAAVLNRSLLCGLILYGFVWHRDHFAGLNEGDWLPYALVAEALIAYQLSVLFVLFRDERAPWVDWQKALPVKTGYWARRDLMAVMIWALLIHLPLFFWLWGDSVSLVLIGFHLLLLTVVYPIRSQARPQQTFTAFVLILFITIFTIYFLL